MTGVDGRAATLALLLDGTDERFDGEGLAGAALVRPSPPFTHAHQLTVHTACHLNKSPRQESEGVMGSHKHQRKQELTNS